MFFKNLRLYRITDLAVLAGIDIREALEARPPVEPGEQVMSTHGWASPFAGDSTDPVMVVMVDKTPATILVHQESFRDLPAAVIRDELNKRAKKIRDEEGRPVGRRERADLKDQITFELLPKAFIKHKKTRVMLLGHYVLVEASSDNQAEMVLADLRKALETLPVSPVVANNELAVVGVSWLRGGLPDGLSLGDELHLIGAGTRTVRFTNFDFEPAELEPHLNAGKLVGGVEIATEEVSFTLSTDLAIRKIKMTDLTQEQVDAIDVEHAEEEAVATYTIMAATFSTLIRDVLNALGGEANTTTTEQAA